MKKANWQKVFEERKFPNRALGGAGVLTPGREVLPRMGVDQVHFRAKQRAGGHPVYFPAEGEIGFAQIFHRADLN